MSKAARIFSGIILLASGVAHAQSSIPQMNQASYPGQLVWLGISFVLLYAIVAGFIAPRVRGVLQHRKRAIADAIAKAEELKATASATKGDFEAVGAEARSQAAALIAKAQADSAVTTQEALAKLDAQLQIKATAAKKEIATATAKAQAELESASASLATAMSAKLLAMPALAKPTKKAS